MLKKTPVMGLGIGALAFFGACVIASGQSDEQQSFCDGAAPLVHARGEGCWTTDPARLEAFEVPDFAPRLDYMHGNGIRIRIWSAKWVRSEEAPGACCDRQSLVLGEFHSDIHPSARLGRRVFAARGYRFDVNGAPGSREQRWGGSAVGEIGHWSGVMGCEIDLFSFGSNGSFGPSGRESTKGQRGCEK